MIKVACFLLSLALVRAEYLYGHNPYVHYGEYAAAYDNYKPRDYKFEYGVSDPHTGDHKSQWEVRENGIVRGSYSLLEPDGTTRIVDYYADDTGFHADVKKIGHSVHAPSVHYGELQPIAKAHIADSIAYNGYGHGGLLNGYGAPIAAVTKVATPVVQHVAPIAQPEYIAPVQQVIAPQIHHLGTPIQHQEYAPHYDAISETVHFKDHYPSYAYEGLYHQPLEKVVLQEPQPFKIQVSEPEHHHYLQESPAVKLVHHEPVKLLVPSEPEHHFLPQSPVAKLLQTAPAKLHVEPHHHYIQESPVVKVLEQPAVKTIPVQKLENPFLKFLAPLMAKYFAPKVPKVAAVPTPVYYPQEAEVYPYHQQQSKAEVVIPHNYGSFDYNAY